MYQICSNDYSGLMLTSNWLPNAFKWEKLKVDLLKTVEVKIIILIRYD